MPRQNRVTPFGELIAVPERGTLMGNRGILHDADERIRRRWASYAWISCVLEFRGRREPVMAPNHYTRLFFLDEPTALAAGHRPCAYCRRPAYRAFRDVWAAANADLGLGPSPRASALDRVLHAERVGAAQSKHTFVAPAGSLPDGSFVWWAREAACLIWRGTLWRWTPGGYVAPAPIPTESVDVLTPRSIVAALAAGYRPLPPALPAGRPGQETSAPGTRHDLAVSAPGVGAGVVPPCGNLTATTR